MATDCVETAGLKKLLCLRAILAFTSGVCQVDQHRLRDQRVQADKSVRGPVVLHTPAYLIFQALANNHQEFLVVEDIPALERTLDQLVRVLLDAK